MTRKVIIDFAEVKRLYNVPIEEAARRLNICVTTLKKICRQNGVSRWPHQRWRAAFENLQHLPPLRRPPGVYGSTGTSSDDSLPLAAAAAPGAAPHERKRRAEDDAVIGSDDGCAASAQAKRLLVVPSSMSARSHPTVTPTGAAGPAAMAAVPVPDVRVSVSPYGVHPGLALPTVLGPRELAGADQEQVLLRRAVLHGNEMLALVTHFLQFGRRLAPGPVSGALPPPLYAPAHYRTPDAVSSLGVPPAATMAAGTTWQPHAHWVLQAEPRRRADERD